MVKDSAEPTMLGVPAARQIVSKMNASEREKEEMVDKLERSCNKFDHSFFLSFGTLYCSLKRN